MLLLTVLTLLFGCGLGVLFGLNEGAITSRLAASAAAARDSVYHGDSIAIKAVLGKSWTYMQRAHLHAGSLGTAAIALTVIVRLKGMSGVARDPFVRIGRRVDVCGCRAAAEGDSAAPTDGAVAGSPLRCRRSALT